MVNGDALSEQARGIWGKAGDLSSGWLPLWRHLADSADVAALLWDRWLTAAVRRRISQELPGGDTDGRRLVRWLAGVHDIGKATPAFAYQQPQLAARMRGLGFSFDARVLVDRRVVPHALAGHVVLGEWLERRHGWQRWQVQPLAVVVGGHHGMPPTDVDIDQVRGHAYLVGEDGVWSQTRDELLDWATRRTEVGDRLPLWQGVELSQSVQVLLTAVVIVADWIASNEQWFPYGPDQLCDRERVESAWEELDLPTPWVAVAVPADTAVLYETRFRLPSGARPYPVQQAVADTARRMSVPGLLIVEAPMGEGKTEAALAAVEILAERSGAGGCFIALPTRATSDAMFSRVLTWLGRVPDADVGRGARDVQLAHGKAVLNTEFSSLYRQSMPSAIGEDDGGSDVAVHRWLAGRKRSMLSSFVIGTIDQLLFGALKARHVVLRHLGLAGKVVVIDEAHAYDVYMSRYLDRALEWLGAHGVSVIVLSATLPARRRAEMMAAYDHGRLGTASPVRRRGRQITPSVEDPYQLLREEMRYPLLCVSGLDRHPKIVGCASSGRGLRVLLAPLDDDPLLLAAMLREELTDGGCALVVCNTVARVQQTAEVLREQFDAKMISVAHSRFLGPDRAAKDRWLRDTFGPPDHVAKAGQTRPARHVVVASQVAEQSLDIDFDFLVTDLAPVDLILQRLGRLHRHVRAERKGEPRCLVRGMDWAQTPPRPIAGSVRVYGLSCLLRSAAVLRPYLVEGRPLGLPADIALLVQAAYGDGPVGPQTWQSMMGLAAHQAGEQELRQRQRAETFRIGPVRGPGRPLIGWLAADAGAVEGGGDEARGRAHVRDDGAESVEVIVLIREEGRLRTPSWLAEDGGVDVPTDFAPARRLARTIATCTLALPQMMTSQGGVERIIAELEKRHAFPAWQKDPWLGGELVLDLDPQGRAQVAGFELIYDPRDGLRVIRSSAPT